MTDREIYKHFKHFKKRPPKTSVDCIKHFQKRCLERIGFILSQRILKGLRDASRLDILEKQSNAKCIYRLRKEAWPAKDVSTMLNEDVILVYDSRHHSFVTTYPYDDWVKNCKQKKIDLLKKLYASK